MFIDLLAAILAILAIWKGLRKGLVMGLFSFLAFIIGLAAALKLSATAAAYLGEQTGSSGRWLPVLAFLLVFLLVALLVRIGGKALEAALRLVMLGWANKLGGIALFLLLHGFIFSILLFYATQLHLLGTATIQSSVVYPYLQPLGPRIIDALGTVIPFFKNVFESLGAFFDGLPVSQPAS